MSQVEAEKASDLRLAQRRVALLLWIGYGAAVLLSVFLIVWALRTNSAGRPRLEDGRGPLAEALKWPWPGFPGVAPVERETIQREFKLDEPLMAADLRLWMDVPEAAWARPRSPTALDELESALRAMRSLPGPDEAPVEPARPGEETPYDPAIRLLSRANNAQPGLWIVLYDRGVLQHRKGNFPAAQRDLESALRVLKPLLDSPTASVYEAAIHTHYALGHALIRGGEGEPADQRARRRSDAVVAFRAAVVLVRPLWKTGVEPYSFAAHPLAFFQLRPTSLSTGVLTSDLVTSYMGTPGYHDCDEKPQGNPCESLDRRAACYFRDRVFCNSSERAGGPFGPPFLRLFHAFYRGHGQAWNEEYRLWALSNAVDRLAENSTLGENPYLLYNLGSLLLQVGDFEPAADLLGHAVSSSSDVELGDDQNRISRLSAVANILAGRDPQGSLSTAGQQNPSDLRELFRQLYEKEETLKVKEFATGGKEFEPSSRSLLDRWLFLRLWRQLLEEGRFERFNQEYSRLMAERGVLKEFFQRWHDEVLTDFGRRALAQAEQYDKAGESDRARLIRRFLSDDGHFPAEIASQTRGSLGWIGWAWRKSWVPGLTTLLLLLLILAGLRVRRLVAAHRQTFFSVHRLSRKGEDAY
jgi:tetratricopeptide (TPR) repeat protein